MVKFSEQLWFEFTGAKAPVAKRSAAVFPPLRSSGMRTGIYAILDRRAQDVAAGVLTLFRHEAAAVRMFTDVLDKPGSQYAQHAEDYQLVRLGYLADPSEVSEFDQWIVPEFEIVLTASDWLSSKVAANAGA